MKGLRKPPKLSRLATHAKRKSAAPNLAIDTRAANIEAHEYSPETGHLTVTFRGGRQYRYEGVPEDLAKDFQATKSQGSFLHAHIIGKFDASKIGD